MFCDVGEMKIRESERGIWHRKLNTRTHLNVLFSIQIQLNCFGEMFILFAVVSPSLELSTFQPVQVRICYLFQLGQRVLCFQHMFTIIFHCIFIVAFCLGHLLSQCQYWHNILTSDRSSIDLWKRKKKPEAFAFKRVSRKISHCQWSDFVKETPYAYRIRWKMTRLERMR